MKISSLKAIYRFLLSGIALLALASAADVRELKKEFRYHVGGLVNLSITNNSGSVTVKPASGQEVVISALPHSEKVEVSSRQIGNRIEAKTHVLDPGASGDLGADYEIQVPANNSITVWSTSGAIHVANLDGDLSLEGDSVKVDVNDMNKGHLHIRTVSGPIALSHIKDAHVQVTSIGGDVQLNDVTGEKVTVNTTSANIRYDGDFGGGSGNYSFLNHSGNIDVTLPTTASVDLSAHSVKGSIENDFPFQATDHNSKDPNQGRTLRGTSNNALSSVELRSFSGKIRVKKQ